MSYIGKQQLSYLDNDLTITKDEDLKSNSSKYYSKTGYDALWSFTY